MKLQTKRMSPNPEAPFPPLKLFNTLSREKEELKPLKPKHVDLYTCGPTVYDYAHIGNFRTYMFEDLLRRTIKLFGYSITQVMNITDVDDKTIRGATKKGITLEEYTKPFIDSFFEDLKTLNIEKAEKYPSATDYIPQMIKMIEELIEKGFAYQGKDGSVYFAIQKFPNYGCLSHLKLDQLKTGASERVSTDEYDKENVSDFVLWKGYDEERDGNIYWESPFGKGRPGWHIECSAMAMELLGKTLDIHVGGVDNMFPHHENEIAQSEACTGKSLAKIWLHAEHLLVENKKMSKSLGNCYTLRDLLQKGYTGKQVRYMLLQTHYKTQLNFTLPGLDAAKHSLERLDSFITRLNDAPDKIPHPIEEEKLNNLLTQTLQGFIDGLADDLNISNSLASLFEMVREINPLLDKDALTKKQAEEVLSLLEKIDTVLGVMTFEQVEEIPHEIQSLFEQRQQARKEKNWALADSLRDQIHAAGFEVEDTPHGTRLVKRS